MAAISNFILFLTSFFNCFERLKRISPFEEYTISRTCCCLASFTRIINIHRLDATILYANYIRQLVRQSVDLFVQNHCPLSGFCFLELGTMGAVGGGAACILHSNSMFLVRIPVHANQVLKLWTNLSPLQSTDFPAKFLPSKRLSSRLMWGT